MVLVLVLEAHSKKLLLLPVDKMFSRLLTCLPVLINTVRYIHFITIKAFLICTYGYKKIVL